MSQPAPLDALPSAPPAPVVRGPRAGGWAGVAAGLFVASAAWALLSPAFTRDAPLDEGAVKGIAGRAGNAHARAFVLVHPPWRDDVLAALRGAGVKQDIGLALPPDAMEGRRPVVLVEWPRAPSPGAVKRWTAEAEELHGPARVRFFHGASSAASTPAPGAQESPAGWTVDTVLTQLRVSVASSSGVRACDRWVEAERRWECPGMNDWNYVGIRTLQVDGRPRRCLWAHPVTGATLNITLPGLPAGNVVVGTGLNDGAAGLEGAADVRVDIGAGGSTRTHVHPNAPGWREVAFRAQQPGELALAITTPHDGARHFCTWVTVTP